MRADEDVCVCVCVLSVYVCVHCIAVFQLVLQGSLYM